MFSRRAFLRTSLQASALVALTPTVPAFLARTARAAPPQRDGRVLVVIQLDGGNDGIGMTPIDFDPRYNSSRGQPRWCLPRTRSFHTPRNHRLWGPRSSD